jgi:hypothetical protein
MKLTIKQTKALDKLEDNVTTELLFGGGAGGGKSAFGCYWQLKRRLKYPGTRGVIGRASLKTLKETTLNSFFQVAQMQGIKAGTHYILNQQTNTIKFFNGSEILLKDLFLYPSDPNFDELGSLEITDAFVDETNQIVEKAWLVLKSRIRYKLDENGLIPKMMGSCNPSKNWVYSRFYRPAKQGILLPQYSFIQSLLSDNPHISKHYRENLLTLDNNSKERLLYGNWEFDDDPAALISFNKIQDLFTNTFVLGGEKYITADIARFGGDKTVIGVWDGLRLIHVETMAKNSITQAVEEIIRLAGKYLVPMSNIIADEDGVGGGVVDVLGCCGFVNNSVALPNPETGEQENYNHLKSQCYFKLAELVNNSKIYLNITDISIKSDLIQELEQVKQHNMDKDAKRQVIPKDKVKEILGRSPDISDMVMMRMWFEYRRERVFYIA